MRILTNLFFISFIVFMSSSCSETKSASEPTILGVPPKSAYFDVFYEYTFGADGGDGLLSYRIVSAPDWLKLEAFTGANPSFRIYGTPVYMGDPDKFQEYVDEDFDVVIEVTDGARASQQTFSLVQQRNEVIFGLPEMRATEGLQSEDIYTGVFSEKCDIPDLSASGEIYPFPVVVVLANPAESRTTLKLAFSSSYNASKDESDPTNLGMARPDKDYINVEKTVTIEAGVSACLTVVDLFNDHLIEGDEIFDVKIIEVLEGFAELPGKGSITIIDDEPELVFSGATEYVTEGKTSQTYTYELSDSVDYDISVGLRATASSTAIAGDYAINPSTLTFLKETTGASFSVDILVDGDNGAGELDEVLIVEADVASVFGLTPLTITINEWVEDKNVGEAALGVVSNAVVVDAEADVVVLNTDNGDAKLLMYNRAGTDINFTADPTKSVLKSAAGTEEAVDLAYVTADDRSRNVYVVLMTDSVEENALMGGASNTGDRDIVVAKYSRFTNTNNYEFKWSKQFGSTSTAVGAGFRDDVAEGIEVGSDGNIYVYGTTTGTFDAGVNNIGGKDAFIYVLKADGSYAWSKMVGSAGDDVPAGIAFAGGAAYMSGSTDGQILGAALGGIDAFEAKYLLDGTFDSVRQWGTVYDDYVASAASSGIQRWVTGYTEGDLTQQDTSNSRGSDDVFFLNYDLSNNVYGISMFGSAVGDGSEVLREVDNNAIIGGYTDGVLAGQVSSGNRDAFVAKLDPNVVNGSPEWVSQFAGDGGGSVIDIDDHNLKKLMVLWKQIEGGVTTYRIKPMDVATGRDLSQ